MLGNIVEKKTHRKRNRKSRNHNASFNNSVKAITRFNVVLFFFKLTLNFFSVKMKILTIKSLNIFTFVEVRGRRLKKLKL